MSKNSCSYPGCERPYWCRGYCRMHGHRRDRGLDMDARTHMRQTSIIQDDEVLAQRLVTMARQGYMTHQIARELGVTVRTVVRWRHRLGVPARQGYNDRVHF